MGAIALGGAAGTLLRAYVAQELPHSDHGFPWDTFWVNIGGCGLLGLIVVAAIERAAPSIYFRPLLGTGVCGGLTTFSTWVVETDLLVKHGDLAVAGIYVVTSLAAGLAAVRLGMAAAHAAWRRIDD
jgi:CrcB protein